MNLIRVVNYTKNGIFASHPSTTLRVTVELSVVEV